MDPFKKESLQPT